MVALTVLAAGAPSPPSPPADAAEANAARLEIPARPLLFRDASPLAPVELAGLEATGSNAAIGEKGLTYTEGGVLTLTLDWVPRGEPRPESAVVVRVSGTGPVLEKRYPLEANGLVGTVRPQAIEFRHPGLRYSGKGTLRVSVAEGQGKEAAESLQYAGPVCIEPRAYPSKLDRERLAQVFGRNITRLNTAFRLGQDATIALPVPETAEVVGLGVVSATNYDTGLAAGEPVARVSVKTADGGTRLYTLEGGRHTDKQDADYYGARTRRSRSVGTFDSADADRPGQDGKPFQTHRYAGRLLFREPVRVRDLSVTFLRDQGTFQVFEMVLLHAEDPAHE